ncbi:hypothetical protein LEP1GSC036_1064 [Leptospira weilii str. 2006001853]|uniref:Uncharacterized protein n=2 Tax=Leptospira weilii TaxID=28184 RepID=A0A828YYS8_9LEPT|nr:hypothetical protein LEP1GSC036_1064 [Leptospira weilii str. 2006001853]EMM73800.1 hypothetical protein LEP1GSC038_1348 [Leptospira weilii str. 2006001855]EMN44977.1 hypothetical protein LEP1GSC086_0147 [Leptospira weilii str. LNT 1234]
MHFERKFGILSCFLGEIEFGPKNKVCKFLNCPISLKRIVNWLLREYKIQVLVRLL